MYDAIVAGARCAGSPTAMLLARAGHPVLLVDRETFPSDTLSTAFMKPDAVARMKRWGLLDRLLSTNVPPLYRLIAHMGPMTAEPPSGPLPQLAPRRTVLDKLLLDAAVEAGAEVREATSLQGLVRDETGRVTGVRLQDRAGNQVTEEAAIVVGADGRNSAVARAVEAERYNVVEPTSCGFYTFWSGMDPEYAEIYMIEGFFLFSFPTNDGLAYVGLETGSANWEELRRDPEAFMLRTFRERAPEFADKVAKGKREDKLYGLVGRESFFRKPYGPGWALVGDAGYLKDPVTGDGVNDAFRDAELLAAAIDKGLRGEEKLEESLAAYQTTRDAAVGDFYPLICKLAEFGPLTPELIGGFASGAAAQAQAAKALG